MPRRTTHQRALLAPLADFLVVNVSSPNTPGLRDLQAVESLRPLLAAVLEVAHVPVLVKIAPDLSDDDVDGVADLAVELGLAGIVATNTTITRAGLRTDAADVEAIGAGGLSGPPVAARSLEVLRRLHERVGGTLVLVSVGGLESVDEAGRASSPGHRSCRHIPASSTAARSGCAGFTANWPLVFAPRAIRAWPTRSARDTLPADNQDRSHDAIDGAMLGVSGCNETHISDTPSMQEHE